MNNKKLLPLTTPGEILNRLLSRLAYADEVQGVDGAQKLSVQELLDASSTGATQQFAAEVEFGKKSNEEFFHPMQLTKYQLAKSIFVPPGRINQIIKGLRAITPDTALRLSLFF